MSEVQKYQEIVLALREDLTLVENFYWMLHEKLLSNPYLSGFSYPQAAFEVREWIYDVFLDKVYDLDSKVSKFLKDLNLEELHKVASIQEIEKYVNEIITEKKGMGFGNTYKNVDALKIAVSNYRYSIDVLFDKLRKYMYIKNWTAMQKINFDDYLFTRKRRKYITAREELETAQQMTKNGKYEEVLNHIRPALELAIKERFGFIKFKKFWNFLVDADNLDFPLPAFDMLYFYYGEGSGRIHAGKLSNPFECKTALNFADGFIERLELINISQEEIANFKKKCNWVE